MYNYDTSAEISEIDLYREGAEAEGANNDFDNKDIQQAVGRAIAGEDGVLGLKGRLTDIFKRDEDLTRGIVVHRMDGRQVAVSAKVIAEAGYDASDLLQRLADSITFVLEDELGLIANTVDVQIAETMTRAGFYEKYDPERAIH